jgi:hypothetical protein
MNDSDGKDSENSNCAALRTFVDDMARLRIGEDDLADPAYRAAFAQEHELDSADLTEDDVIDALDVDRLQNETAIFWEMVRRARTILARS